MAEQVLTNISGLRRSPLAHLESDMLDGAVGGERAVTLREIAFTTQIGLRAEPGTTAHAALAAAAGVALPEGPGQVTGTVDGVAVLWQGPDEFLLVAPDGSTLLADLVAALGPEPGQVVDLSANRTIVELHGPSARAVLEKGCPADLHPRAFGPGHAIMTTLGKVPLLLWQTAETTFRLLPRASFADYTAHWLLDAMKEYADTEVR